MSSPFISETPDQNAPHGGRGSVALPNEIPAVPDFSSLPPSVLHSGTVETLLGLNDDLMARLKVSLRRNSVLEQQILELEKLESELTHINQALSTQLDLHLEKGLRSDGLAQRLHISEEQVTRLKAALRVQSSFRRRVVKWVKPLLKAQRKALASEELRANGLAEKLASRDAQLSDVRARLSDAITHIQNQDKTFLKDQARLVEQYENKQTLSANKITKLETEIKVLKDKALRVDQALSAAAEAENRIIFLERRAQELEARLQTEVAAQKNEAARYRKEAKGLAMEKIDLETRLKTLEAAHNAQLDQHEELQDRFESLQGLWKATKQKLKEM